MKNQTGKIIIRYLAILLFFNTLLITLYAQNKLPDVKIKTLSGKQFNFNSLGEIKDTAIIVSFWATWCKPCIDELESINDIYPEKQNEMTFRMYAISVDDARTASRVNAFVKGRGWIFDVLADINNDLKRALNINEIPHVIVIKNGIIEYQSNGYIPGNEQFLFDKVKSLNDK